MSNLVSTDWLARHLNAPDVVILDASWHLPTAKRDAHAEEVAPLDSMPIESGPT